MLQRQNIDQMFWAFVDGIESITTNALLYWMAHIMFSCRHVDKNFKPKRIFLWWSMTKWLDTYPDFPNFSFGWTSRIGTNLAVLPGWGRCVFYCISSFISFLLSHLCCWCITQSTVSCIYTMRVMFMIYIREVASLSKIRVARWVKTH